MVTSSYPSTPHSNAKLAGACARVAEEGGSQANPKPKTNSPICALVRIDSPLIVQFANAGIRELLQWPA